MKRAEKERQAREASSPPTISNQAALKGREAELESEYEGGLAKSGVIPVNVLPSLVKKSRLITGFNYSGNPLFLVKASASKSGPVTNN